MAAEPTVALRLNRVELYVMVYCVQALETFFERRPPEDKKDLRAVGSALKKLVPAHLESLKDPYDRCLEFSGDEQEVIDFALHMTMTDATMAQRYSPVADAKIGPDVRLSDLARYVPVMATILRRLETAQRLGRLEQQVEQLQARSGQGEG